MPLKSVQDFDEFEALLAEDFQARRQCAINLFVLVGTAQRNILGIYCTLPSKITSRTDCLGRLEQKNTKGIINTTFADTIIESVLYVNQNTTIAHIQERSNIGSNMRVIA